MTRLTAAKKQARITAKQGRTARDEQAWEPGGSSQAASATAPYDPLLTIEQVSDWLGVPKGTLYQWRSRNQGPVLSRWAEGSATGAMRSTRAWTSTPIPAAPEHGYPQATTRPDHRRSAVSGNYRVHLGPVRAASKAAA
jgi:hypothetical protein